jgi:phenylacetic acid degradation operon negative regulatory protein
MKPKTELFLYHLLWHADLLMRPSFRNLNDSYEGWAYRRGFLWQIRRLEAQGLLERQPAATEAIYRLSDTGRVAALGGKDPDQAWDRPWDGLWHTLVFDVPVTHDTARTRLRRRLRQSGFGYLQNSVWISPDPIPQDLENLVREVDGVEFLTRFAARTSNPETDSRIVETSWPFQEIDRRYKRCIDILEEFPIQKAGQGFARETLLEWSRAEHAAWKSVLEIDPFLPSALLPIGYQGQKVWNRRRDVLARAGEAVHQLDPSAAA